MTKAEIARRLRWLAARAREEQRCGPGARVEVGVRLITLHSSTPPKVWFADDDDLAYFVSVPEALRYVHVTEGQIVHLYVSTWGDRGELQGISMGWIGTDDQEPWMMP